MNILSFKNKRNLYILGTLISVFSIIFLLYHSISNIVDKKPIYLALLFFIIIKMIGVFIKLPYIWDKYWARLNIFVILFLYFCVLCTYLYGIFIAKL